MSATKEKIELAREEREANIAYYMNIDCFVAPTKGVDSGARGKAKELQGAKENSLKTRVGKESEGDGWIIIDGKKYWLECKTNGGRVGAIVKKLAKGKDGFVRYQMDICNSNTKGKRRTTEWVLMRYSYFIELLKECGALRANSRDGEPCIQVSSKKLYLALLDYPTIWEQDGVYSEIDIPQWGE